MQALYPSRHLGSDQHGQQRIDHARRGHKRFDGTEADRRGLVTRRRLVLAIECHIPPDRHQRGGEGRLVFAIQCHIPPDRHQRGGEGSEWPRKFKHRSCSPLQFLNSAISAYVLYIWVKRLDNRVIC